MIRKQSPFSDYGRVLSIVAEKRNFSAWRAPSRKPAGNAGYLLLLDPWPEAAGGTKEGIIDALSFLPAVADVPGEPESYTLSSISSGECMIEALFLDVEASGAALLAGETAGATAGFGCTAGLLRVDFCEAPEVDAVSQRRISGAAGFAAGAGVAMAE